MNRELLQQALNALEWLLANIRRDAPQLSGKAMGNAETACTALREALVAPQPEPYAHLVVVKTDAGPTKFFTAPSDPRGFPVYLAPPAAPADMVMVEALRKARKALDGIDATACCDHWANMNSSARRYAIARDARAAVQDIDRVLLAAAPAPAVPDEGSRYDRLDAHMRRHHSNPEPYNFAKSATPVVREPQPEPVQRLMRFAGKKRSEVSNPCLTAREAIVIADWMQANGIGTTGGGK